MDKCYHNLSNKSCFDYPQSYWCKHCTEIQDVFEILKMEDNYES